MYRRKIGRMRAFVIIATVSVMLGGCKTDLYSKLSEVEANEIISTLSRNNISASRVYAKDGTSTIRVEESSFSDAVSVLNDTGLPRQKFVTMGDIFADTKLVSSPMEERARFIYALSQELSKTLSEIDGVFAARVHLVLPRNDPLRQDEKPSSASVFIKHDATASVSNLMPQIKTLVTNSIEGLTYDKVSVVFVPAEKRQTGAGRSASSLRPESASGFNVLGMNDPYLLLATGGVGWLFAMGLAYALWRRVRAKSALPALWQ